MTSWRESASQQAQDDLDGLLDRTLPFAIQQLDSHGEFFPFGALVSDAGEARMVAADPSPGARPGSAAMLDSMVERLRHDRGGLRAVALATMVRTADGGDAVRVELEHSEGQAIAVLLPYRKKRLGRGIEYGSLAAGATTHQIWTS